MEVYSEYQGLIDSYASGNVDWSAVYKKLNNLKTAAYLARIRSTKNNTFWKWTRQQIVDQINNEIDSTKARILTVEAANINIKR